MEKAPHIVWGIVVSVVALSIVGAICFGINAGLQFDKTCVQNHKSITRETKPGEDYAQKECK